jgi:hypothetical protein
MALNEKIGSMESRSVVKRRILECSKKLPASYGRQLREGHVQPRTGNLKHGGDGCRSPSSNQRNRSGQLQANGARDKSESGAR